MKRRLAAILAADIAGYSRLMREDEAPTVRDLNGHQAVILPLVGRYGGRIIDTAGDGILAEFPSVINATECAVEIQTIMAPRSRAGRTPRGVISADPAAPPGRLTVALCLALHAAHSGRLSRPARRPLTCAVPSAGVRVWHLMSR